MHKACFSWQRKNVLYSAFQVLESYLIYYTTPLLSICMYLLVCVWDKYSHSKFITVQIELEAMSEPASASWGQVCKLQVCNLTTRSWKE